jgi:prepilin-type N-terminal cleavage/methylation domain-containing protein
MFPPLEARPNHCRRRQGFTLTETLVVIAIGVLLASLTAAAAMAVFGRQKSSNTETVLKTLYTALDQQWRAVIDAAKTEPILPAANTLATDSTGSVDDRRARVIHITIRLKQEFPMNFTEALANPSYATDLAQLGVTGGQNPPAVGVNPYDATESSVCLYLALQKKRKGASFDLNTLGANVTDGVYKDPTNGNVTLKQFVDGWGTGIRFYRWPTANGEVDALDPAPATDTRYLTFRNPLDRDGLLMNASWWGGPQRATFEGTLHSVSSPAGTAAQSYYVIPVIASAGPNHQFEITQGSQAVDPMAISATGSDDIYSYRLLSLGARGG